MEQPGTSPEVVPLPRGGGAIRGIGDTFSPDLHTGTGSYRVPLWFPRGPGGLQPEMALVYSSGAGNGPYGMGWHLPVMTIQRRTDRGLPAYDDAADTFLLDGEELVPVAGDRLRALREENFRLVAGTGAGDGRGFEVRDRGGRRFLLGTGPAARVEDGGDRTLAWLVERAVDPHGNAVDYTYLRDGGRLYLSGIRYGPYSLDLRYEARPDVTTDRRPGFDLATALRLEAIEYRLAGDAEPFRRYGLRYDQCPHTRISLLAEVTCTGHRDGETAALPALRLGYTPYTPGRRLRALRQTSGGPPPGLDDPGTDLVDLDASGLPGVVQLAGQLHRYWPNLGGELGPPRTLRRVPGRVALADPAVAFADMNGDGAADLLLLGDAPLGYVENTPGEGLTRRARFRHAPAFAPADPDVRLLDLNGDGLVDAMRTGQRLLYLYRNRGAAGWDRPVAVPRIRDLARFPDVFFSDPRVKLADLTGDGLADIAWVHGGRVDYWPHYGDGRFGARVTLGLAPAIGLGFDPRRLLLADVNGDGVADAVYLDRDRVLVWVNRGGRELALAAVVRHGPAPRDGEVRAADMLGTGVAGLVSSGPAGGAHRYLDLTSGVRPYLLASIDDGTGLVTEVEYRPSTEHARAAARAGAPWRTALPFPVQVVTAVTQRDSVSGTAVTRRMRYHDGLFDGRRREFRGFGRVEVTEEGDAETPSALTTSWFHQGVRGVTPGADQAERDALAGRLAKVEITALGGPGAGRPLRVEEDDYAVRPVAEATDGRRVLFPHLAAVRVRTFEGGDVALTDTTTLEYNDLGNVVGKRERWDAGDTVRELVSAMRYTEDTTRWILNLPVELRRTDAAGRIRTLRRFYYDGTAFTGLPLGRVARGALARREDLVVTDDMVAAVYGPDPPDHAALGHHRVNLGDGVAGWAVDVHAAGHDARGNENRRRDPFGNVGAVDHDAHGIHPERITDPLGHVFTVAHDLRTAEVTAVGDPNGATTAYRHDPLGRLAATIKPGDTEALPTSSFEYPAPDAPLPLGVRTRLRAVSGRPETLDTAEYFDGFGRTVQLRTAAEDGRALVDGFRRYNARGWEAERTTPFLSTGLGHVPGEGATGPGRFRFRHDAVGRVIETITPDGRASRVRHEAGRVVRHDVNDADDSPENVARGHFDTPRVDHLDARGALLAVEERLTPAGGPTTRYTYDPLGRLTQITDARGVLAATYVRDLLGRVIQVDHVDAGRRRAAHDGRGDLALLVDAAGRRIELAHDALGRPLTTTVDGAVDERFAYDAGPGTNLIGRLAEVTDQAGRTRYAYTARGLLAGKTRETAALGGTRAFTVRYEYDALERMVAVTHPGGAPVAYHYNERGLVRRIDGFVDLIRYNALGQPTEISYANGTVETRDHDDETFYLNAMTVTGPARPEPYHRTAYTHDGVGNPLTVTEGAGVPGHPGFTRTCSYDPLYRLTGAAGTVDGAAFAHTYTYDDAGNLRRNGEFGPGEFTLEPGTDRLRGVLDGGAETPAFAHDANGDLTALPGLALRFDPRGRLIRAEKPDGTVVEIAYDHAGARVRKRVTKDGATAETLYVDGIFEERDGTPTRFIANGDARVAMATPAQTRFLHFDAVGNVVLVTGTNGEIVLRLGHHAFGTTAFAAGASMPYGFLGHEQDETGLIYCRARYYHPALGRFVSPDLLVILNPERVLALPMALNPYAYAANNPMRLADPDGAFWKWVVGGLIITALVVATIIVGVATGGAGFAFGLLLAASIGSALGGGIGAYSAWRGGGNVADGFLFGTLVGAAAGAGGYLAGAAVGAGLGGTWGAILAGAAEGAVVGAGNGAIIGYAGGAGSMQDIITAMAVGFAIGAVLGGLAGYLRHANPDVEAAVVKRAGELPGKGVNPVTGQPVYGAVDSTSRPFWQAIATPVGRFAQFALQHTAYPLVFAGVGSTTQALLWHDWDAIKSWVLGVFGGDEEEVIVPVPGG